MIFERWLPRLPGKATPIDRVTMTDDELDGFRITIPARPDWPLCLFYSFWLIFWVFGEVATPIVAIARLASGQDRPAKGLPPLFVLLVWFPFWTVGGLMVMFILWWNFVGREVILLSDGFLVVRREAGFFQRARSYDMAEVRNLRYAPLVFDAFARSGQWQAQFPMLGSGGGSIAFEQGDKTQRFGIGLSEAESARLIATIKQRHKIAEDRAEPLPISH